MKNIDAVEKRNVAGNAGHISTGVEEEILQLL
jgi:hypothetical protein